MAFNSGFKGLSGKQTGFKKNVKGSNTLKKFSFSYQKFTDYR